MKKEKRIGCLWLCLILGAGLMLSFAQLGVTKEGIAMRTQGLINPGGNLRAGYLLVNEMRVYLNSSTQIMDHLGGTLPATELKPKKWVYIEFEKDLAHNATKARKIYLLPHYISPKERKQYAFMK